MRIHSREHALFQRLVTACACSMSPPAPQSMPLPGFSLKPRASVQQLGVSPAAPPRCRGGVRRAPGAPGTTSATQATASPCRTAAAPPTSSAAGALAGLATPPCRASACSRCTKPPTASSAASRAAQGCAAVGKHTRRAERPTRQLRRTRAASSALGFCMALQHNGIRRGRGGERPRARWLQASALLVWRPCTEQRRRCAAGPLGRTRVEGLPARRARRRARRRWPRTRAPTRRPGSARSPAAAAAVPQPRPPRPCPPARRQQRRRCGSRSEAAPWQP